MPHWTVPSQIFRHRPLQCLDGTSKGGLLLQGLLLIDEAYVDFVDPELNHSTIELVNKHPNVLILRSFSKVHPVPSIGCDGI